MTVIRTKSRGGMDTAQDPDRDEGCTTSSRKWPAGGSTYDNKVGAGLGWT